MLQSWVRVEPKHLALGVVNLSVEIKLTKLGSGRQAAQLSSVVVPVHSVLPVSVSQAAGQSMIRAKARQIVTS